MACVQIYKLGDWKLQSGQSIPNAEIAYKTLGDSSLPAVIYPTWYSGCVKLSLLHKLC
jgi:homoserine acetyltransferase